VILILRKSIIVLKGGIMNPGRELDALVAEKVMDLSLASLPEARDEGSGVMVSSLSEGDLYFWDRFEREWSPVPKYSTDIAVAWEVVVKIREMKPVDFNLFWNGEIAYAEFKPINDNRKIGDTAPHAICLAALEACGVEV
jgi:hypothetical protein